ncbi:hypothetical protein U9R90_36215, partial [Streptomyces sp. E11-3]|uniref:lectin-like domain-containing protein n=1 Tax=Streptomyces sp. E11-3 TaxID=3110112 RepID=UPI00397F3CDF
MSDVQFPIIESFTEEKPHNPNWQILGSAQLTGGSLQLTSNGRDESGTAFLDEAFDSKLGVSIEFDYAVQGSQSGDGFSVYLIDGSHTTQPGALGAGLGYSVETERKKPGVTAGYVGVGFDNYGNFSTPLAGANGIAQSKDSLVVRGSGDRDHYTEFRRLTTIPVSGGFRAGWDSGAHVQITVIDAKLTVRTSSKTDPNGKLLLSEFDLSGQIAMPATFKIGLAAGTGGATEIHEIRNLRVSLPAAVPLAMTGPQSATAGDPVSYT